jgi:hypothetical protein
MKAPALAIGWTIWRRHRWGLTATAGCMAAVVAASTVARAVLDPADALQACGIAVAPLTACALYLAAVFAHGFETDLVTAGTAFPARMFTLPVRTTALAGWPMAYGAAALALLWLVAAGLILRPAGLDAPLWWPALMAAAVLAWVQALVWWPFGLAWVRLVVGLVVAHLPISGTMLALKLDVPEWAVSAGLGVALAAGLVAARAGVGRARRGAVGSWGWLSRVGASLDRRPAPRAGFGSAGRALAWYERRRHGLAFPLMVAALVPLCLMSFFLEEITPPIMARNLGLALVIPVFLAGMAGGQVGRTNAWVREHYGLSSFAATRPVTTAAMVAAKLRSAARTTLATWGLVLALVAAGLFASGAHRLLGTMFGAWLDARPAGEVIAALAVAAVLLVLLTWKRMVESLMLELIGREWVVKVMVIAGVFFSINVAVLAMWLAVHPEYHAAVRAGMPWVLSGLACLKLASGAVVIWALRRKRLVTDRTLLALGGVWLGAFAALFGTLAWLVPADLAPAYAVATGVLLLLPLARLSAMPLALDWNRHR